MTRPFHFDQPLPEGATTLIEASAGTGKTWTLAHLVLRLVVEHRLKIGEILVVTFTEAATGELQERVRRRLREALVAFEGGPSPDPAIQSLVDRSEAAGRRAGDTAALAMALARFDEASISTIHGFCSRVLRENAFESKVPWDLELLSDLDPLLRRLTEDWWVRFTQEKSPEMLEHLAHQGLRRAGLMDLAAEVLRSKPKRVEPELPADAPLSATAARLDYLRWMEAELPRRLEAMSSLSFDDLLQRLDQAIGAEDGQALADALYRRYPVALIDEFQDTDPVQYRIFSRVYKKRGRLFLIGDPKQAIYGFRGADIFAYRDAVADAGENVCTLELNFRSDEPLVRAVNQVFGAHPNPFALEFVSFHAVKADKPKRLEDKGVGSALVFRTLEVGEMGKGDAERLIAADTADDMLHTLFRAPSVLGRPLAPGDLAVLVATNDQGRAVQKELRKRGLPCVLHGESSVFQTEEASALRTLLQALAQPTDERRVRTALATHLFGLRSSEIVHLRENEAEWERWMERFRTWANLWSERSFIVAFRSIVDESHVRTRLLDLADGERRLTDLLHLAEMAHAAAVDGRLGPSGVVRWLRDQVEGRGGGDGRKERVRLETDAEAVKILTIHKSKGLQFPLVWAPFLWRSAFVSKKAEAVVVHDPKDGYAACLDLGGASFEANRQLKISELRAEHLRLAYVALTRAEHRCTVHSVEPVWWAQGSALDHLLHQGSAHGDWQRDLDDLAERSGGDVAVRRVSADHAAPTWKEQRLALSSLDLRVSTRHLSAAWRRTSFSALSHGQEHLAEAPDRDAQTAAEAAALPGARVRLWAFDRGARAGTFLHEVLENVDFAADVDGVRPTVAETLLRHGYGEEWVEPISEAVVEILDTPVDLDGHRLREVGPRSRRAEIGFTFPVAGGLRGGGAPVRARDIAAILRETPAPELDPGYPDRLAALDFLPVEGFLTGFIDLVYEHGGRWSVLDWKSNHLGNTFADYRPAALAAAMAEHHYPLQAHLYLVALHRLLRQRLPGYDYDTHVAGAAWLFLRGMPHEGVYRLRPPKACIEALSQLLGEAG